VVTGTSTGSLIATFAFLGPAHDDEVRNAYLGIRGDHDVFDKRFLLTALFSDGLATTGPLRRRLETFITPAIVAAVARERDRGRRLYVGAVDIDQGIFQPWDLTEIASAGGEAARRRYIDTLMASAAIPVAFSPITIDGVTYVDGGVRRNIFLQLITEEVRRKRVAGEGVGEATVYALVNGTLNVGAKRVKKRLLDVARRSVDILLDESTDGNLFRIHLQAQKEGLRFLMTRIPPDMCGAVGSPEDQFDPALMACLYADGRRFAREDQSPWREEPPLESQVP
jgi:predicted acylesterase/phospholipase RssA